MSTEARPLTGRAMFFNILATFAEFEVDLLRLYGQTLADLDLA